MKTYYRANDQVVMAEITLEDYNAMTKQIAELQERIKELEICCIDKANKLIVAGDKISRRNLQIADLKKKLAKASEIINDTTDGMPDCEINR